MWILESVSEIPLKKPFLIVAGTLGATFLLLAYLFSWSAMQNPATFVILALALYVAFSDDRNVGRIAALSAANAALAWFLLPRYPLLFSVAFTLVTGKLVFPQTFRVWKWIVCSLLLIISLQIIHVWEQISLIPALLPAPFVPVLYGGLFGFCALFSFLIYATRKDSVLEACDSILWDPALEAKELAFQTVEMYRNVQKQLREMEHKSSMEELESCTERMIHLCHRMQVVELDLKQFHTDVLQEQIELMKEKISSVTDSTARLQYEQTLANKEKQAEQRQSLEVQQERMRAQTLHYISALENMRFSYASRNLDRSSTANESIDFFLDVARARSDDSWLKQA